MSFLLILYASILVINVIVSAILWYSTKSRYYKIFFLLWLFSVVNFMGNGIVFGSEWIVRVMGMVISFGMVNFCAYLITALSKEKYPLKRFVLILVGGITLTGLFYFLGLDPHIVAFPVIVTNAYPVLEQSVKLYLKHKKDASISLKCLYLANFLSFLHGADFAFLFDVPSLQIFGFVIVILLVFSISLFGLASIIDIVSAENSRIKTELEYKLLLADATKMASIGEIAAGISHEINNPLTVLNLNTEELQSAFQKSGLSSDTFLSGLFSKNFSAINKISGTIKSLRMLTGKTGNNPFAPVPVVDIIKSTLNLRTEKIKSVGIALSIDDIDPDITIYCDQSGISQVLLHLLNNAVSALENAEEKRIHIGFRQDGDHIYLSVTDSGPGIPDYVREKLFEPVFIPEDTGKQDVRKGIGVGLSISRNIVEMHNGSIYLDKSSAKTCFVVKLGGARID